MVSSLVKPCYFDMPALLKLLQQSNLPQGVVKSDDFILSAHLQYRKVSRIIVSGGTPPTLTQASSFFSSFSSYISVDSGKAVCLSSLGFVWKVFDQTKRRKRGELEGDSGVAGI